MSDKVRTQNQDDWKRTQVRIPQDQYDDIVAYAENKEISLNTAMIELMDNGLKAAESRVDPADLDVRIFKLKNGMKRLVYGKLLNAFELDFSQNLTDLREDIETSLNILKHSKLKYRLAFFNKNVFVYQGNNHLDVVDNGVGSLNWLIVEDHITDEFMQNNMQKLSKSDELLNSIIEYNKEKIPHVIQQTAEYTSDKNFIAIRANTSSATSTNRDNLIDYIKLENCEQIYLFATSHTADEYPDFLQFYGPETNLPLLGAVAQIEIQNIKTYVIFDGLFLTAQRRPRYLEVEQVLNESILSSKVSFITSSAPFTRHLNTIGAVEELISLPVKQLTDISRPEFFSLLSNYPEKEM